MTLNPPTTTLPLPVQTSVQRRPGPVPPYLVPPTEYRKFTVAEYHHMIQTGILKEGEPVELLEGSLVLKMSRDSPHDCAISSLLELLFGVKPQGYVIRCQSAVTLSDSEPEPDFALARGTARSFKDRHPVPAEVVLVLEVSESSLAYDRIDKNRIYARDGIPEYWIANLVERQIEVYTDPTGPVNEPVYRIRKDYTSGSSVPVVLDGAPVGTIAVDDVLP